MLKDYVASYSAEQGSEILHFGTKGMKWGIRNDTRPTSNSRPAKLPGTKDTLLQGGELYKSKLNYAKLNKTKKVVMTNGDVGTHVRYGEVQRKLRTNNEKRISRELTSADKKKYRKLRRRANLNSAEFTKDEVEFLVDYGFNRSEGIRRTRKTASNLALPLSIGAKFLMSEDETPNDYVGAAITGDRDISHYGVKGMRWGIKDQRGLRSNAPGSSLAKHRAAVDKKHLARDKQLSTKGTRIKRGVKTGFALGTYGVSALATRAISKHSDDITPQDYLGVDPETGISHFGVKGMHWGVRNPRSSSSKVVSSISKQGAPTRARRKEDEAKADAKKVEGLLTTRAKIESGNTTLVRDGKRLSSQQSLKVIDKQVSKLTPKPSALEVKLATKLATKLDPTLALPAHGDHDRYNQLKKQVHDQGAKSLSDDDLKYLNSRTEAVSKAQKAFQDPKSWLVKTVQGTIDTAIQAQLKKTSNKLMEKYVGKKIDAKLNLPSTPPPTPPPTP